MPNQPAFCKNTMILLGNRQCSALRLICEVVLLLLVAGAIVGPSECDATNRIVTYEWVEPPMFFHKVMRKVTRSVVPADPPRTIAKDTPDGGDSALGASSLD